MSPPSTFRFPLYVPRMSTSWALPSTFLVAVLLSASFSGVLGGCAANPQEPVKSADASAAAPASGAAASADDAWLAAARRAFVFDPAAPAVPAELVASCSGARVVGLGELSHGTHDDAMFKSALALALIDAGQVDTLYIEANRTGGEQLDAFLRSGGGDAREAVRDASIFRVLKTEGFEYLIAGMQQRVASGRALRIVGIDCQDTRPDAEFALARLATRDAGLADQLRARLAPVLAPRDPNTGATADKPLRHPQLIKSLDTAQLKSSIEACHALRDALAGDSVAAAGAERAAQGLLSFEFEVSDGNPSKADMDYFSLRDRFMAENILADGAVKGAFWGHNIHIVGGPRKLLEGYVTSGSVLREALGPAYRIVVCDYTSARISAVISTPGEALPDATGVREIVTRGLLPNGLASAVAGATPHECWIDLASLSASAAVSAWRSTPRVFDWPGYAAPKELDTASLFPLQLANVVDVIVVLDDVGPARMIEPRTAEGR